MIQIVDGVVEDSIAINSDDEILEYDIEEGRMPENNNGGEGKTNS